MSFAHDTFVQLTLAGFAALFPVMNPIGTAFVVMPYMVHPDDAGQRRAVLKISAHVFCVCIVVLLAGQWILELSGLSVPVAHPHAASTAGCSIRSSSRSPSAPARSRGSSTLSAHGLGRQPARLPVANTSAIVLAIALICVLVLVFYLNTRRIVHFPGSQGERSFNR